MPPAGTGGPAAMGQHIGGGGGSMKPAAPADADSTGTPVAGVAGPALLEASTPPSLPLPVLA
jgi:hypothetical protein